MRGMGWKGNGCGEKKDNTRDLYGDGNVLYPDCINVNILDVILYYSYIRCHTGGNWAKDICESTILSK